MSNLEQRFTSAKDKVSARGRRIMRSILEDPESHYFLSSHAIAAKYEVNPSTIVRLVQSAGYRNFSEFSADLREYFVNGLTPRAVVTAAKKDKLSLADRITRNVERDIQLMTRMVRAMDTKPLVKLARRMYAANRVMVVGVDGAEPLAKYLAYSLTAFGRSAEAPVGSRGNLFHSIRGMGKKDVLIAISFRQCLKDTVASVEWAKSRKVYTFGVTDTDTTPIAKACDAYALAPVGMAAVGSSYVATMALLNAIVDAYSFMHPDQTLADIEHVEAEDAKSGRWCD